MTRLATILAQGEDGLSNILYIVVFLLISLGSVIAQKAKEKREKEQAARQREQMRRSSQPAQTPPAQAPARGIPKTSVPPSPGRPDQAVEAMREALRQRQTVRRPPPIPSARTPGGPPAAARPVPPRRPQPAHRPVSVQPPPDSLFERHVVPSATGSEVDQEIAHLRRRLEQAEKIRRQRMSEPIGSLVTTITIADERHGGEEVGPVLEIDLLDASAARRGIALSEVLGSPAAIRDEPPGWRPL